MFQKINNIIIFINKNKKKIIKIVVTLIVLSLLLFSDYGLIKRAELVLLRRNLEKEVKTDLKLRDSLYQRIERLYKDTTEIERIAREYYGMIKPTEKVLIILNDSKKADKK